MSGVRRRSKRVPAVTDVRLPQAAHFVSAIGDSPPPGAPAPRTDEALGPTQSLEVVQAVVGIRSEPSLELPDGPRVAHADPELGRLHILSLVRSDEYPPVTRYPVDFDGLSWWALRM